MRRGHSAPEAILAADLRAFLAARGWRPIRMESGYVPGAGSIGEKGQPDWLYLYYRENAVALALWIETKPPGYKPRCNCRPGEPHARTGKPTKGHECRSCGQKRWAEAERKRGATVLQVDDLAAFTVWYESNCAWLPEPAAHGQQTNLFEPGNEGSITT